MVLQKLNQQPLIIKKVLSLLPFPDETPEITIGNRTLPSRYFLAPLAGYTHLAFRTVIRELGGLGLATTDLIVATHLLSQTKKSMELVKTSPVDQPLSVQIFSGWIEPLVEAAKWLEAHQFACVDINMGCPMAKINSQGGGARLMCDIDNACNTIGAVVDAVNIPVTVKMRLGWDRDNIASPILASEFEKVGVAAITIHGRTRQQGFHGKVDYDGIRQTVEAVQNIPVVGNGDVLTVEDAFRMRKETGCSAVAIGRGAMLDPWIFKRLQCAAAGKPHDFEPTPAEHIHFLTRHFELMTEQYPDRSHLMFRKFAGWYGAKLGIPNDLEDRLRRFESADEFQEIIKQIHQRHGERESELPTALLRVPNGPVDKW